MLWNRHASVDLAGVLPSPALFGYALRNLDGAASIRAGERLADSSVVDAYDQAAAEYAMAYALDPIANVEDQFILDRLIEGGYLEGRVLDVGCGAGMLVDLAALPEWRYVGLDPSERMRTVARRLHPKHMFAAGSSGCIPDYVGKFESAVALFGVLSYFDRVTGAEPLARVVEPGGKVFLMGYGGHRPNAHRRYIAGERSGQLPPVIDSADAVEMLRPWFEVTACWGMSRLVDRVPVWLAPIALRLDVLAGRVVPDEFCYVVVEAVRRA